MFGKLEAKMKKNVILYFSVHVALIALIFNHCFETEHDKSFGLAKSLRKKYES